MIRSTQFFAALLLIALTTAWVEWTAEDPVDLDGKVVIFEGDSKDVSSVRWVGEDTETTITRKTDTKGEFFWVDYTRWTEKKAPVADKPSDTGEAEEPEVERIANRSVFKSADRSVTVIKNFSPLAAKRSLEVTDEAKLEELGLLNPVSRIEIVRGSQTEVVDVGSESYGSRDYFARHQATGRIYLLERDLIQPLKYARTRLPDRTLTSLERPAINTASISVGAQSADWKQNNADDKQASHWVAVDNPDDEAEDANEWLEKMVNLKGTKYADPDNPPDALQERFRVTFTGSEYSETVTVSQVGEDGDWYAQSAHTRGLIKLVRSGASDLSDQAPALLVPPK